jgi:hypothetical protein
MSNWCRESADCAIHADEKRENPMSKITYNGQTFDFEEIRRQMDPDLAEQFKDTTKTDQDFFDSYLLAHSTKYGEHFVVD